jgi:hypothetical protein
MVEYEKFLGKIGSILHASALDAALQITQVEGWRLLHTRLYTL